MDKYFTIENSQQRFLELRIFVGISRNYFEKFGFSAATIKSWETPRSEDFQINKAKVKEYILIYEQYLNIKVSLEWLIYGIGNPPAYKDQFTIGGSFEHVNKTVDLMLNNLPFFFLYDEELILRRINPLYAHLISNDDVNQIENKSLANILDRKTFMNNKLKFNDALDGKIVNLCMPLKIDETKTLDIPLLFCPYTTNGNKTVFSFIEKII